MISVSMFYDSSQLILLVNKLIKDESHFISIQIYQCPIDTEFILNQLGQKKWILKTNVDPNIH